MYELQKLPYSYDALEPYIEKEIMELHHLKHEQSYVNGLNAALTIHPELAEKKLEDLLKNLNAIPEDIRDSVRNHGGGVSNHRMFFNSMQANAQAEPHGHVADAIKKNFGSFEAFKDLFTNEAKKRFGSGWAWMSLDKEGRLVVSSTANQDTPLSEGLEPVLGLDVWEHAYYLQYQNRRPDYIQAWWHVIDWDKIEENYQRGLDSL